jgi:hypothetical protein
VDRGPALPVEVCVPQELEKYLATEGLPIPPPVQGMALIDTGCTITAVDGSAILSIGVKSVGTSKTLTAGGPLPVNLYPARFNFPSFGVQIEYSSMAGVDLTGRKGGGRPLLRPHRP